MGGIKSIQRITLNYYMGAGCVSYGYTATINVLTGNVTVTSTSNNINSSEEDIQANKEILMQHKRISISNTDLPSTSELYEDRNITLCHIDRNITYGIFVRFDHIVDVNKIIVVPPISLNNYNTSYTAHEKAIYKIYPAGLIYRINKDAVLSVLQIVEFE